ncbi:MAG: hypothetical protein PHV07_03440 [Oscillospiraceae bacterium]|nr:hypothetical protein [Oscillospiraceae bacterium]
MSTYYIDTAGDNNNDGRSPSTPFKNFDIVNEMTLKPGDRVLLKCNCVFNDLLIINGKGTEGAFIEVSNYGNGNKPKIERNGQIWDRCIRVNNPSYLKLNNIEVCNGGTGIVIFYDKCYDNRSVYISNILAHDFFGIYRACGESSSVEEWKDYKCDDRVGFSFGICVTGNDTTENNDTRVLTDFRVTNTEIYNTGGGLGLDWCDHKNSDGTECGKNKFGDVVFKNLYLHDNNVKDVSLSSLFIQCVNNLEFSDSKIDVGAGGAPWGAAAVHLQLAKNILIDNVVIDNMPHTGTNDECAIDFETDVEDCVIKNCSFSNNAGAALEFLANIDGSATPVSRNIKVINCKFNNNNWAKIYPNAGQIQIVDWNTYNRPTIDIINCEFKNTNCVEDVNGDGDLTGVNVYSENIFEAKLGVLV